MPVLAPGVAIRSREAAVLVENRLEAGAWRFRLTVIDDAGNESAPAELVVRVQAPAPPTGPTRPGGVVRPDVVVRPDATVRTDRPIDPRIVRPVRPPG